MQPNHNWMFIITIVSLVLFATLLVVFRKQVKRFFDKKYYVTGVYVFLLVISILLKVSNAIEAAKTGDFQTLKIELFLTDLCPFVLLLSLGVMPFQKVRQFFAVPAAAWSIYGGVLTLATSPTNPPQDFVHYFFGTMILLHWIQILTGITLFIIADKFKSKWEWVKPVAFIIAFLVYVAIVISIFNIQKQTTLLRDADMMSPNGEYAIVGDIFKQNYVLGRFVFYILSVGVVYSMIGIWYFITHVSKENKRKRFNFLFRNKK